MMMVILVIIVLSLLSLCCSYHNSINKRNSIISKTRVKGLLDDIVGSVTGGSSGIDVSGLKVVPISDIADMQSLTATTTSAMSSSDDIQNYLIFFSGLAYLSYERRPRGSARDDLLLVRRSTIPNASNGIFAKAFIPKNTLIGTYPGFIRKLDDAMNEKLNDKAKEDCKKYLWAIDDDTVLDPTTPNGSVDLELKHLFGLFKVSTLLCRINEPPLNGDCNVFTKVAGSTVEVYTERDIFEDEELFMDYGGRYKRDDYIIENDKKMAEDVNKRKREEEESLILQSIVSDNTNVDEKLDQDTTMSGFIRKLGKQDENKYKNAGILSPDEAADMFAKYGPGMFNADDEDKDLMSNLTGEKGKSKSKKIISPEEGAKMMGASDSDKDLLNSLMSQLGGDKRLDNIPDIMELTGALKNNISKDTNKKFNSDDSNSSNSNSNSNDDDSKTLITDEEANNLQRRLDDLTDDQLEKVFTKMRSALADKMQTEMSSALSAAKEQMKNEKKDPKKMNRTEIDPNIKAKYGKELTMIEDELEKMYQDPLGVWQEMIENPDKFMAEMGDDEASKGITDDPLQ